jgi:single-stranded DNA-binding protein
MLTLVANGYVTGDVKVEDGDYGKRAIVSIRSKTTNGKQSHYVNASFYGKKIDVVSKFMEDGRQVTIVGSIKTILPKKKKDGTDFVAIYMDATDFSLPERQGQDDSGYSRKGSSSYGNSSSEEEVPF